MAFRSLFCSWQFSRYSEPDRETERNQEKQSAQRFSDLPSCRPGIFGVKNACERTREEQRAHPEYKHPSNGEQDQLHYAPLRIERSWSGRRHNMRYRGMGDLRGRHWGLALRLNGRVCARKMRAL